MLSLVSLAICRETRVSAVPFLRLFATVARCVVAARKYTNDRPKRLSDEASLEQVAAIRWGPLNSPAHTRVVFLSKQVANMSHRKAMTHIRQASWPLVLRFRLPLEERDVFSLSKIAEMRCAAVASLTMRLRATREYSLEQGQNGIWNGNALKSCDQTFLQNRALSQRRSWSCSPFPSPILIFSSLLEARILSLDFLA